MSAPYRIPAEKTCTEIIVKNSRFVAHAAPAPNVDAARKILADIRAEMPDASHHVYAFRCGFGNSVTEGMSDDGEPSGTAGPPVLAVLRGSNIGDIILIVTRYFGGTKLGTGGLVRAYSAAARSVINALRTEEKIEKRLLMMVCPYSLYERSKRLIEQHAGLMVDESFTADITVTAEFPSTEVEGFTADMLELSAGQVEPITLD